MRIYEPDDDRSIDLTDDPEDNVDEIINELVDRLLHAAIDAESERERIATAALTTELRRRTSEEPIDFPPEIDPLERYEDGYVETTVDDLLRGHARDLVANADELPGTREDTLEIAKELCSRINGSDPK